MKLKHFFNLFFLLFAVSIGLAQEKVVRGTVTSDTDGEPLLAASVVVKGTTRGTQTDFDGNYEISVKDGEILVFSFVGYTTQERRVSGNTLNVKLKEEASALEEVVVTGYGGTQKRIKTTNSIATVKAEVLEKGSFSNPAQALAGAVSGVRVTQRSGNPGTTPTIILRGGTNFDGTGSPLVIVDGQVRDGMNDINPSDIESIDVLKDAGATAIYGARANNGVVLITTKKGKQGHSSINVGIKHGFDFNNYQYEYLNARQYLQWQRSAIYESGRLFQDSTGAWRGYNAQSLTNASGLGTGNRHFDANGNVVNPNTNSSYVYSTMFSSTLTDAQKQQLLSEGWETMTDPATGNEIIFKDNKNIRKNAFRPFALTKDYTLSMTGGNEKGKYYAGLGFFDKEGMPWGVTYRRLNFTFNGDYKIKEWLTSTSNLAVANADWTPIVTDHLWGNSDDVTNREILYHGRALSVPPTMKETVNGEMVMGTHFQDGNPKYTLGKFIRDNQSTKINLGQSFRFDLLKGLSFTLNGYIMFDEAMHEFRNRDFMQTPNNYNRTREIRAEFGRTLRQTYNGVLNYQKSFGNHNFDAMAGYEFYDSYKRGLFASGSGAPVDDLNDLSLTLTEEGKRSIDSWHSRIRIKSYFGRLNYDFDGKYLASFTIRRDGYSSLLGDNRWGVFPGASVGWVFSREDFAENFSNILSFGKLRGSFGLNGNASGIGAYDLQGTYSDVKYKNAVGFTIYRPSNGLLRLYNPALEWEKSRTFEVGLDLSFLQNRISLNTTYYNRLTIDKYADIVVPISSGDKAIRGNNGELLNKGVEIEATFRPLATEDWNWTIGINASYNKNIIKKLPYNGLDNNRQGGTEVYTGNTYLDENGVLQYETIYIGGYQEGQSYGDIVGYIAQGIYRSQEDVQNLAANRRVEAVSSGIPSYGPNLWATMTDAQKVRSNGRAAAAPIAPGDVIWKDMNGDNIIDVKDQAKIGSAVPNWTGGISSTLSYKGISLYVRMDYALGHTQVLNTGQGSLPWVLGNMQGTFNPSTEVLDTWTPDNPNAKYPRYLWADQLGKGNYDRASSMFAYKADYLAFREVALSYRFDKEVVNSFGVNNLEVSLSGQNLGYWTKSKAYSPEIGGFISSAGYVLPRTVLLGVNVTF